MAKTPRTKASEAFAIWVKVKGCLDTTGLAFVGVCYTCGRRFHIDALDCGHFVSGRRNAVLFEEDNVRIQCEQWCNLINHGNPKKYRKHLIKELGLKRVEEVEALKHKVIQDKDMDFEVIEKKYTQKYKDILRKYGYKTYYEMLKETRD